MWIELSVIFFLEVRCVVFGQLGLSLGVVNATDLEEYQENVCKELLTHNNQHMKPFLNSFSQDILGQLIYHMLSSIFPGLVAVIENVRKVH